MSYAIIGLLSWIGVVLYLFFRRKRGGSGISTPHKPSYGTCLSNMEAWLGSGGVQMLIMATSVCEYTTNKEGVEMVVGECQTKACRDIVSGMKDSASTQEIPVYQWPFLNSKPVLIQVIKCHDPLMKGGVMIASSTSPGRLFIKYNSIRENIHAGHPSRAWANAFAKRTLKNPFVITVSEIPDNALESIHNLFS